MILADFEFRGHRFYISYAVSANAYLANIEQLEPDHRDRRVYAESFGTGHAAEDRLIEWMKNPEEVLKNCLTYNEAVASGKIKVIKNA